MPNAGFVGVRHREYTKVCDSAFLFRASSRAAGRRSNSKDNTVNGFMCMSHTRVAGVGHSRKAELIKQRYFHSMPYAGFAGVRHRKEIALNWVEYWLALAALFILLCPTSAKPTWGIKKGGKPKGLSADCFAGFFISLGFLLISFLRLTPALPA